MLENTLILYPSKFKTIRLLLLLSIFIGISILMITTDPENVYLGYFSLAFWSILSTPPLVSLFPNASYLKLTPEGFEVCSTYRKRFTKWEHIKDLRVASVHHNNIVGYDYTKQHPEYKPSKMTRKMSKALAVPNRLIPNNLEKSVDEVLILMEDWKTKYN